MNSIDGLKTCRKGLHQYPADKRTCPECKRAYDRQRYAQNADLIREKSRRWREQNPERSRENVRRWHEKNADRVREWRRCWQKENRERKRENERRWYKKNPHKVRAYVMLRIARKKNATPPWSDQAAIKAIYAEAVRLERETGIPHHVDHIYPLSNPYMCGLHVAENLQVIPGPENLSKGNRTWPGQLECQRLPLHMNGFNLEN